MKKLFIAAVSVLAIAGCSQQKASTDAAASETDTIQADSTVTGHFEVIDLDDCKLHVYLTDDQMADASFIIEGKDSLITLEQPLFKVNALTYDEYLASLGKPVAARISDFHLGNTGADTLIMPKGMPEVVKGEAYSGMMNHFAQEYGDKIVALPTGPTEEVAFDTTFVLAGIPFTFIKGANNDFPGANIVIGKKAVYSHWAPSKTHINKLYAADMDGIAARKAELEAILATGATTFVGGHGSPASAEDVRFRIEYLNKIKELRDSEPDASAFAQQLVKAYPGLPGEEGVTELAESLYAQK